MTIPIVFSIIAVIIVYLQKYKIRHSLEISFILMTLLSALRFNFGNDYPEYLDLFNLLTAEKFSLGIYGDPGWHILCRLFSPLGYESLIACVSFFLGYAYYKTIKRYVPSHLQWLSMFIYVFDPNLWLLQQSMLRQSIVAAIFLLLLPLIEQKKILKSVFIILLSSSIHISALILMPILFLPLLGKDKHKLIAILIFSFVIIAFLSSDFLGFWFQKAMLIPQLSKFENYTINPEETSYGLGYLISIIPYIVSLVFLYKKKLWISNSNNALFISITFYLLAQVVNPFSKIAVMITRVTAFFIPFSIIVIPHLYAKIKPEILRVLLLVIFILLTLYIYYNFWGNPSSSYHHGYENYRTIFSNF